MQVVSLESPSHRERGPAVAEPPPCPAVPRDLKRALEFIRANACSSLSVGDIVGASGVPARTLFQHFYAFTGVSPMRYVRDLRFALARRELLSGNARCVTETAGRFGFTHLGRFSIDYRRRFGEPPSETLARCRPDRA